MKTNECKRAETIGSAGGKIKCICLGERMRRQVPAQRTTSNLQDERENVYEESVFLEGFLIRPPQVHV